MTASVSVNVSNIADTTPSSVDDDEFELVELIAVDDDDDVSLATVELEDELNSDFSDELELVERADDCDELLSLVVLLTDD